MKNTNSTSSVLLLLSGGVDSTCLISYHLSNGQEIQAVFVNYGQPSFNEELKAVKNICNYYNLSFQVINLGYSLSENNGEFSCRNALLILTACNTINQPTLISIGLHDGTPYYDSTPSFINDIQLILNGYYGGTVKLIAPFQEYAKSQIFKYADINNVPINLTYSCEKGLALPCGNCPSCIDRRFLIEIQSS